MKNPNKMIYTLLIIFGTFCVTNAYQFDTTLFYALGGISLLGALTAKINFD
jgi:hypothetical protein